MCLALGIFKELVFILAILFAYKSFVGGVHARTNLTCLISTLSYFLINIYACKFLVFDSVYMYIMYGAMFIFGIYIINKYVPADTEEVPIINKELRKSLKLKAYIMFILMYIISAVVIYLNIKNSFVIANYIIISMFIANFMTINIMYKLFKCSYGYKGGKEYESIN